MTLRQDVLEIFEEASQIPIARAVHVPWHWQPVPDPFANDGGYGFQVTRERWITPFTSPERRAYKTDRQRVYDSLRTLPLRSEKSRRRQEAVQLFTSGVGVVELARRFEVDRTTMRRWLRKVS